MLICRILWMDKYQGIEKIRPENLQGRYAQEHDFGHECWNWLPHQGKLYGFFKLREGGITRLQLLKTFPKMQA